MIQGGDIENGDGTGTTSIYDGEFADENLDWRELDAAGLICSANRGKDTNGSQFFVTLDECPHLNGKHTIFGRLVSGEDVLKQIAKVAVDDADRPVEPVLIARCGELARKEKKKRDSRQENTVSAMPESDDRGRRRKSDLSDDEMDSAPPPQQPRRTRRQSDNIVDEGKRGRPRIRSRSRSDSNSQPLEEVEEPTSDHSLVTMHKRKRSQSPSRHVDRRSDGASTEHRRRRRSLPNQYNNHRDRERNHGHGDEDRYRPSPRRDTQRYPGRQDSNRHRPRYPDEGRLGNDGGSSGGRLGGGDSYDDHAPAVKYKGRGAMKFREPDRAW